MPAVRRATGDRGRRRLHRAGLITYSRGIVSVLDGLGLEAASCECYRIMTDEYRQIVA